MAFPSLAEPPGRRSLVPGPGPGTETYRTPNRRMVREWAGKM